MSSPCGTILVVDDDHAVRRLLVTVLTTAGYSVTDAASGARALELCECDRTYDLLITDVKMPGVTGVELAQQPACQRACRAVLFVSGCTPDELRSLGFDERAQLLRKPFRPGQLIAMVRAILD